MPRRASSRDRTGEISRNSSRSRLASTGFSNQRRPVKERATPNAALGSANRSLNRFAAVPRADPAHRAGGRAHHHAFGGDKTAVTVHAAQHETVGDTGRREPHTPPHQIAQAVFAVEILDAPF